MRSLAMGTACFSNLVPNIYKYNEMFMEKQIFTALFVNASISLPLFFNKIHSRAKSRNLQVAFCETRELQISKPLINLFRHL